jgi:S1-C subfamily serine protease
LAKLRKLLPEVAIDYRQGALLGVASNSQDALGPAVVSRVEPGSAAAAAGVLQGDIIQKFDGEAIPNFKTLTQKVGSHQPGDEIMLGVVRDGKVIDLKVKLGKWKTIEAD